jgi:hypothetical protein
MYRWTHAKAAGNHSPGLGEDARHQSSAPASAKKTTAPLSSMPLSWKGVPDNDALPAGDLCHSKPAHGSRHAPGRAAWRGRTGRSEKLSELLSVRKVVFVSRAASLSRSWISVALVLGTVRLSAKSARWMPGGENALLVTCGSTCTESLRNSTRICWLNRMAGALSAVQLTGLADAGHAVLMSIMIMTAVRYEGYFAVTATTVSACSVKTPLDCAQPLIIWSGH